MSWHVYILDDPHARDLFLEVYLHARDVFLDIKPGPLIGVEIEVEIEDAQTFLVKWEV